MGHVFVSQSAAVAELEQDDRAGTTTILIVDDHCSFADMLSAALDTIDGMKCVATAHRDQEWITRAAQAGACAFIPKNGSLVEMIDVLRRARFGQLLVAPSAYRSGSTLMPQPGAEVAPTLTGRELDVLNYLGQGMPARGIARVLGISIHTCRGYLESVHAKLGVSSQLEAVIKAKRLGLIDPPGMRSAV